MDRWVRLVGFTLLLRVPGVDPGDLAQPMHPVLRRHDTALQLELVSPEPTPQRRVLLVEFAQRVDDVCLVPAPLLTVVLDDDVRPVVCHRACRRGVIPG